MTLLETNQILAVVDKLLGQETFLVRSDDLHDPWLSLYSRLEPVGNPAQAREALWRASQGLANRQRLVDAVLQALPASPAYPSLQDLSGSLPAIRWLWPGWIPRGLLSLLGGAPGSGKSLVALDLARRWLQGEPFPQPAVTAAPLVEDDAQSRSIVYVDAESVLQVLNQRARAWGMDRSRLYPLLPPDPYGLLDLGSEPHQDLLADLVGSVRPDLVVVDSLSAISLKGENNIEDVRHVLAFLAALAREFDTGLLLVHHLRKQNPTRPRQARVTAEDLRGSSHIIATARSVLALSVVQTEPPAENPDRVPCVRRLEVVKSNLCSPPAPLGLVIEPPAGGDPAAPVLRYTEPPVAYRSPTQAEACAGWLIDLLAGAGRPLKPKQIVQAAREAGFGRSTLYRARRLLGPRIAETGQDARDPTRCWGLAE